MKETKQDKLLFPLPDISTIHSIRYHYLPNLNQNLEVILDFFFLFLLSHPTTSKVIDATSKKTSGSQYFSLPFLLPSWFKPSSFPESLSSFPSIPSSLSHPAIVHFTMGSSCHLLKAPSDLYLSCLIPPVASTALRSTMVQKAMVQDLASA